MALGPCYNTYIGARYVPIFAGEWDATKSYEPLTIVQYQGNSYTSKTFVAAGIPPTNTAFWAETGNYNAQIEQYREEVRQLVNKYNALRLLNVMDYGAKGDGITDDTQAFINAFADAKNSGGFVYIPPNTYSWGKYVPVYSNTVICGYGATMKLNRISNEPVPFMLGNYNPTWAADYDPSSDPADYNGFHDIHFYGLNFNINIPPSATDPGTNAAIVMGHCNNISLTDMTFQNSHSDHFLDIAGCKNVTIQNCIFKDEAGTSSSEMIQLDNCSSGGFWYFGKPDLTPCLNVTIENCKFENGLTGIGNQHVQGMYKNSLSRSTNVKINKCSFTNMKPYCIYMNCTSKVSVTDCVFNNSGISSTQQVFINAGDYTSIENCKFMDCLGNQIQLGVVTVDSVQYLSNNCSVNNSFFLNCQPAWASCHMRNCPESSVTNNQFKSIGGYTVAIQNESSAQVTGNSFFLSGNSGQNSGVIFLDGTNPANVQNNSVISVPANVYSFAFIAANCQNKYLNNNMVFPSINMMNNAEFKNNYVWGWIQATDYINTTNTTISFAQPITNFTRIRLLVGTSENIVDITESCWILNRHFIAGDVIKFNVAEGAGALTFTSNTEASYQSSNLALRCVFFTKDY